MQSPDPSLLHPAEPKRLALANLPTPLQEMPHLAADCGLERLLVKRDDLTGLETSGNKVRKLEYVIAAAREAGADTLVTHGGFQSNHCRATAAIAARLGMHVRLLLRSSEANPPLDGNLFLDHLFGAEISYHPPEQYSTQLKALIEQAMDEQRGLGRRPYFFPVGASIPLGCWGYIRCVHELIAQLGRQTPVDVYCAVSSSGTHAGLILGKALFECERWRVLGVPVSDSLEYFQRDVRNLVDRTIEDYGLKLAPGQTPVELIDGFIGEGYAIPYPAAIDTLRQAARREGLVLDPTYTAKALTGMLSTLGAGTGRAGAVPVFIHTGGAFGLMARRDLLT